MNFNLFKPVVGLVIIPVVAIFFVIILILYKIYYKIRSRCNILVNCWFCNENFKVLYTNRNSWTCPDCEQYNGFTKSGDYNKEIYEQFNCSNSSNKNNKNINYINRTLNSTFRNLNNDDMFNHSISNNTDMEYEFPLNGFCNDCNENQRLKIEKLGQFEPKKESNFEKELIIYKSQLEEQYRLCSTCEHHLKSVLREKKKMVLGSKLLDFIVRGANNLQKHPKIKIFKKTQNMKLKIFISYTLLIVSIINFVLIIYEATNFIHKGLGYELSDPFVRFVLICVSHILALLNVIQKYIQQIFNYNFLQKLYLFTKTILFISLQAFGYKLPVISYCNINSILLPFGSIFLTFLYNLLDGFQLSRYTILLTIWSAYACTTTSEAFQSAEIYKLITATVAIILSIPQWNYKEIDIDKSNYSFHKIYSENYYLNEDDEDDSISLLSSKLNQSSSSLKSFNSPNTSYHENLNPPLRTSSILSLTTPIPSFQHFVPTENDLQLRNSFNIKTNIPENRYLFGSNMDLNRISSVHNGSIHRASSTLNGSINNLTFCCGNGTKNPTLDNRSFQGDYIQHSNFSPPASPFIATSIHNGFTHQRSQPCMSPTPYSYSTNTVCNNRHNLLTPSRLQNTIQVNHCNTSWVSGGYFNTKSKTKCNNLNITNDNSSRASSQSSGFESTASNNIRLLPETEFLRENSDSKELDTNFQNSLFNCNETNSFRSVLKRGYSVQPIDNISRYPNGPKHDSFYNLNGTLLTNPMENQTFDWRRSQLRGSSLLINNSFNLDKINEELPSIKKGRLLQNWNEQNSF